MFRSCTRSQYTCRSSSYPPFFGVKPFVSSILAYCTRRPQIHDYPRFVRELTRILRPGGLLILIEFDMCPIADGQPALTPSRSGIPGWCRLQEEIKRCLRMRDVDISVPERMAEIVDCTDWYKSVRQQQADIPIGFWPKGALRPESRGVRLLVLALTLFRNLD